MPGAFKQLLLKRDIKSLFNFERDKKPTNTCSCFFDAYIVASETLLEETKAGKKFTVYKISVTNGPIHWFVLKRYSEFHKLHGELQALFPHIRLPSLPPKRLIGNNTSPSFVQSRKQRLGQYLREISEDPILCSSEPILEFFQDTTIAQESLYGTSANDIFSQSELSSCGNGGTKRRTFSFQVVRQKLKFKNKKFSIKRRKLTNKTATKTTELFSSSTNHEKTPMGLEDFFLIKVIGKGSYGKVILARHKDSGRLLAIKSILKKQIHQKPIDVRRIMAERNVLKQNASHPFLVGLHYAFQTPDRLCFCIDYINGGELFYHLQHMPRFSEDRARFYVAEITSALEHLHSMSIIYRDLKPENCLLDGQGHIRLVDFGLAKQILGDDGTTSTFCGTPEYLAPEVLQHRSYDKTVDWYCLGAVLYEMLSGMASWHAIILAILS
ncbi:Serine/threonine-protein kinase Sgk2 [Basidiobolus ranarum]|uniref:Serine/threonine-protein kinase Sgk2 n=1 Tax=Basidiobolus ranarum TaxID=34480 RepID=A0ABR2W5A4_9FUNG